MKGCEFLYGIDEVVMALQSSSKILYYLKSLGMVRRAVRSFNKARFLIFTCNFFAQVSL